MIRALPRWRNVLIFKNALIQPKAATATAEASSPSSHLASFHCTSSSYDKRKINWNFEGKGGQRSSNSKSSIRFTTRQKRSDTKKALKDLLYNYGCSTNIFEEEYEIDGGSGWEIEEENDSDTSSKKARSKSSARNAIKARHNRMKRKLNKRSSYEDFDKHPDKIFHATFGNRCYTWSFNSRKDSSSSRGSTPGFEWREEERRSSRRRNKWRNQSDVESDDDEEQSCFVGSISDRLILGLPTNGRLKIEDIKNAFRLLAMKWHPDKHQGPSKAIAEEKFKSCLEAYKSLCTAFSSR